MRGRQVVPAAAPAEEEVAGDVALVRDGPVRVAEGVRRLAAAVGLDALTDLALGVRRAARLQTLLDGHVPVRRLAGDDPLGPDDAGVPDVDDVGGTHVEPDPEAGGEDRRREQDPHRPARPAARRATRDADPDPPADQVHERRIDEGRAREDVPPVEEPERHREGEHREQVERAQRERAPPVDQADEEERAEAQPDRIAVDLLAAERARVAARHLPRDLRPRPRLGHVGRQVVDVSGRDLAGGRRVDVDVPVAELAVELGARGAVARGVASEPVAHLRVREQDRRRAIRVEPLLLLRRRERRLDDAPLAVVDRSGRSGRRGGGRRPHRNRGRDGGRRRGVRSRSRPDEGEEER